MYKNVKHENMLNCENQNTCTDGQKRLKIQICNNSQMGSAVQTCEAV